MTATFDDLMGQMPSIAKAVNAFESEAVQQAAFEALVAAALGDTPSVRRDGAEEPVDPKTPRKRAPAKKRAAKRPAGGENGRPRSSRRASTSPQLVRDLNLRPKSGQHFVAFVDEHNSPKKNNERLLLAVFWLERVAQVDGVTADHVYTCFKEAKWKVPANLRNALQVVATRKGWITTTNMDDIKVEIAGENFVEHDLTSRAVG